MSGLPEILVLAIPLAVIGGLLSLADRARARRTRRIERQIALTDAIHRELGAAAAPEVTGGPRGGYVVRMGVPLHQPALVGALARITHELFARVDGPGAPALRLVLEDRGMGPHRVRPVPRSSVTPVEPAAARRLHAA